MDPRVCPGVLFLVFSLVLFTGLCYVFMLWFWILFVSLEGGTLVGGGGMLVGFKQ